MGIIERCVSISMRCGITHPSEADHKGIGRMAATTNGRDGHGAPRTATVPPSAHSGAEEGVVLYNDRRK